VLCRFQNLWYFKSCVYGWNWSVVLVYVYDVYICASSVKPRLLIVTDHMWCMCWTESCVINTGYSECVCVLIVQSLTVWRWHIYERRGNSNCACSKVVDLFSDCELHGCSPCDCSGCWGVEVRCVIDCELIWICACCAHCAYMLSICCLSL